MAPSSPHSHEPQSSSAGHRSSRPNEAEGLPSESPFLTLDQKPAPPLLLAPDTKLGPFTIQRRLAAGSVGQVYLARYEVSGREVAVKVVNVGPGSGEQAADPLRHETAMYHRIWDYRHVLKVHEIFLIPWQGTRLLVLSMEYAEGGTLRSWLRSYRDDPQARAAMGLHWFHQICRGVAAIHAADLIHLDLKPENFLFVGGVLKVADLSVSRMIRQVTQPQGPRTRSAAGEICSGTPHYMSPEHFTAADPEDLDVGSDLYSLGVILYEILHPRGRRPFYGSREQLYQQHTQTPPPALPDTDPAAAQVIDRCLQKDPAARYQGVEDLLADLEGEGPEPIGPGTQDGDDPAGPEDQAVAQVEEIWDAACRAEAEDRLNEAQRLCRQIVEQHPGARASADQSDLHAQARRMLEQIEERSRQAAELYAILSQGMDRDSLDQQCQMLAEAVAIYPDHPAGRVVQIKLRAKSQRYRQAMEGGLKAAAGGDWATAVSLFQTARDLNPGSLDAEGPLGFATDVVRQAEDSRHQIDAAIQAGDRRRALALAERFDTWIARLTHALRRWAQGDG